MGAIAGMRLRSWERPKAEQTADTGMQTSWWPVFAEPRREFRATEWRARERGMMILRNWFGLRCRFKMCQGEIDHDKHSVFYRCLTCGKKDRERATGDHWEPLPDGER